MKNHLLSRVRPMAVATAFFAAVAAGAAPANLVPDWLVRVPLGTSLTAGMAGMVVDDAGNSYLTGISGPSSNTDITTAAYAADGTQLWSRTFNGPENESDQGRGLTLSPDGGILYVVGNTQGPQAFAQVLLLAYDTGNGNLLKAIQYSSGPGTAEHGASVATDAAGNIYVAGGTVGDGADALVVAFDPDGSVLWKRTWDGPAFGPFSQDNAFEVLVHPDGNPVVLIHGVMGSNHPDYIINKYAANGGATLWSVRWGVSGEDSPSDMQIDAQGDVYVTGTGIDLVNKFSTIKLKGTTGALLWQAYDKIGYNSSASALTLDGQGSVYVTGGSDPDDDRSNFNDNMYTVKRSGSGALLWTHFYGSNCVGCYDVAADVSVDPSGNVFVTGVTSSPPYSSDAILFQLDANTGLEVDRGITTGPNESVRPRELHLDPAANLLEGGIFYHVNTGQVDMYVGKYPSLSGGGIPCADTRKFVARCVNLGSGNRLQARLTMTDTSHDGEPVTMEVDGTPRVVTIDGFQATLAIGGAAPGPHGVELTDPAGCFPIRAPVCPGS